MSQSSTFSNKEIAVALTVVVIWGLNFVAMKLSLREFTPMQLGAARYLFAAAPLLLLFKPQLVPWRVLATYGLLQGVGQFGLLFLALQLGMSASLASVLMQTQVFFTALLGWFLLRERLTRTQIGSMFLALLGLLCFGMHFGNPNAQGVDFSISGFVLTLCAAFMWGASSIAARKLQQKHPGYDALQFVMWSSIFPVIPFLALSYCMDGPQAFFRLTEVSAMAWVGAIYLGLLATVTAYGLWTWLLKRKPANQVAPIGLGVPVIGLLAGMGILGESLSGWQIAGIVWIGASLIFSLLPQQTLKWLFLRGSKKSATQA